MTRLAAENMSAFFLIAAIVIAAAIAAWVFSRSAKKASPPDSTRTNLQRVKVRHVIDGDTVVVTMLRSEIRIRLYAIDCPEDGQPWGNIAKAGLIKLIGGRTVHIEAHGSDRYGRTLATIYRLQSRSSDWTNVNERMVMLGHAWVTREYFGELSKSRQRQLSRLESWARSKRVGLWKTHDPVPPWRWRNGGDAPRTKRNHAGQRVRL